MKKWVLRVSIAMVASISFHLEAGMRCENGKLANKNDKTTEVSLKCGKPTKIEKFGRVTVDDKRVYLERWTYVPEKGKFIKFLDFHNGILVEITNGKRSK
jgi:hypothetical protein